MADNTPLPPTPKGDVDMDKPHRVRGSSQGGSPPKSRRSDGDSQVTVDLIRTLLAEQHSALLQAQKQAVKDGVHEAVKELEARQEERFQQVDARAQEHSTRMETMEKTFQDFQTRLHKLEQGSTAAPSSSAGSTADGPGRNRNTLVIGGFERDTRRGARQSPEHARIPELADLHGQPSIHYQATLVLCSS